MIFFLLPLCLFGFFFFGCDRNTNGWPTRNKKELSSGSANVTVTMGTDMLAEKRACGTKNVGRNYVLLEGLHHAMNHSKKPTASRQLTTRIKTRSLCGRSCGRWVGV